MRRPRSPVDSAQPGDDNPDGKKLALSTALVSGGAPTGLMPIYYHSSITVNNPTSGAAFPLVNPPNPGVGAFQWNPGVSPRALHRFVQITAQTLPAAPNSPAVACFLPGFGNCFSAATLVGPSVFIANGPFDLVECGQPGWVQGTPVVEAWRSIEAKLTLTSQTGSTTNTTITGELSAFAVSSPRALFQTRVQVPALWDIGSTTPPTQANVVGSANIRQTFSIEYLMTMANAPEAVRNTVTMRRDVNVAQSVDVSGTVQLETNDYGSFYPSICDQWATVPAFPNVLYPMLNYPSDPTSAYGYQQLVGAVGIFDGHCVLTPSFGATDATCYAQLRLPGHWHYWSPPQIHVTGNFLQPVSATSTNAPASFIWRVAFVHFFAGYDSSTGQIVWNTQADVKEVGTDIVVPTSTGASTAFHVISSPNSTKLQSQAFMDPPGVTHNTLFEKGRYFGTVVLMTGCLSRDGSGWGGATMGISNLQVGVESARVDPTCCKQTRVLLFKNVSVGASLTLNGDARVETAWSTTVQQIGSSSGKLLAGELNPDVDSYLREVEEVNKRGGDKRVFLT